MEDRAKLRMWLAESRHRHSRCGTFDWEWPDDRVRDPWEAFVETCPACYKIDAKLAELQEGRGKTWGRSVRLWREGG